MQNDLRMPINKFLFIGLIIAFWNFASFMLILPPWNYLPADPGWVLLPLIVHVLALMIAAIDTKKRLNREINYASMNPVKRIIVKYVVAGFLDRINGLRFWGLFIAFWDFISFRLVLPPWNYLPADPGWILLPLAVFLLALMLASIDTDIKLDKHLDHTSRGAVRRLIVKYIIIGALDRINGLRFWGLFIAFTSFFYILILQNYFTSAYEFSLPASLNFWVPFIILILGLVIASIEREMSKS